MQKNLIFNNLLFMLFFTLSATSFSAEKEEHRNIAQHALATVLLECRQELHANLSDLFVQNDSLKADAKLWSNKAFGEISAYFSGKDISFARSHHSGHSILKQLHTLPASLIEDVWQESRKEHPETVISSFEQSDKNVIVNYLLHHLIALRFARQAGNAPSANLELLRAAFVYEAMALSYLTDAFSSSHLLLSLNDFLSGFHSTNNKIAHDFYRSHGVYVINSSGNAWQTFGDELMQWYEPTYRHVLEAAVTSLREFLLVFYFTVNPENLPDCIKTWADSASNEMTLQETIQSWLETHEGYEYYATFKMPSLLLLPVPVTASWSVRTTLVDAHGIHERFHYPQLRNPAFHDPDLDGIDAKFLYPNTAVPDWWIPEAIELHPHPDSTKKLIKEHAEYASVRFIQERNLLPGYKGLLFHFGGGTFFESKTEPFFLLGLGYSPVEDLLWFNNLSFDLQLMALVDNSERILLNATISGGIKFSESISFLKAFRLEGGYAGGFKGADNKYGYKLAAGLELPVLPLSFTYAGITSRLMLQRIYVGSAINGLYLQFILH